MKKSALITELLALLTKIFPTNFRFYHIVLTSYALIQGSGVRIGIFRASDWHASIRSNGSLWLLILCSLESCNMSFISREIIWMLCCATWDVIIFSGCSGSGSFPKLNFTIISHVLTTLRKHALSSSRYTSFAFLDNRSGFDIVHMKADVSSRIFIISDY